MRAVVLSGGGSKGAYQIGVWRALKKLNISYDLVTGTSVGALNGALMVQKDYLKGLLLWYNMDFKLIFGEEIKANYNTKDGKKEILKHYTKNILLDGGMDITRLENTVSKFLNVQKFYKSPVDMGFITFKLSKLEPMLMKKKEIEPEKLKDYLIASASCFPAFKKKKIDNEDYIDGGIYDNLPINLAIDMGATEIIAIDLKEVGIKQKVKDKNIPITYISPNNDIGSFLVFQKDYARLAMHFGYNDTMKVFKKLEGDKYTFKKGELEKNYLKYKNIYFNKIKDIFLDNENNKMLDKVIKITALKRIIYNDQNTIKEFNKNIESLGILFDINQTKIYTANKFNKKIISHYSNSKDEDVKSKIKNHNFKMLFNDKYTIKYIVRELENNNNKKDIINLALLFPNEFLSAVYIYSIK